MRIKRRLPVLFGFLLLVAALALAVTLRKHAPPEPARLLPGADGFVYVDLKWMRWSNVASHLPAVPHDQDYEQFIQATGFQFERDLQQAAVAVHYATPQTGGATRFSEVFIARIDGDKLRAYLKKLASSIEDYRSISIYNIPFEDRTIRVAILGVNTVAVSNHNDPTVIRGIIDRSRKLASPFGGPLLLRQFYKHVPLASLAWGIFHMPPQSSPSKAASDTFRLPFEQDATIVGSVRYLGAVHFRAEAFTASEQAAEQLTQQANVFLRIFQSAEISAGGQTPDTDIKKALASLKIEQKKDRTVLTATVPVELIRKIVAEAPKEVSPGPQR